MVCGQPVRGGGECSLDSGHRGHHSTVVFVCEGCGKTRRGQPHATELIIVFGEIDDRFEFCFLCSGQTDADIRRMERLGGEY